MTDPGTRLDRLGEALQASAREDLAAAERREVAWRPRRRRRLQLAVAVGALVVAIPAVALATGVLSPDQEVAQGLPMGLTMLAGTDPVCATLRNRVEYDCVLSHPPAEVRPLPAGYEPAIGEFRGKPGEWTGYVTVIVDASHHISGGCRAENGVGTSWRCYLGEASIRHQIIGRRKLLGEYLPGPVSE